MSASVVDSGALRADEYPPVLNVANLGLLIGKSPATILSDRVRAPERVPPAIKIPGSKQPLWILADVLEWLRQYQEPAPEKVKKTVAGDSHAIHPRRGHPGKAALVAKAAEIARKERGAQ